MLFNKNKTLIIMVVILKSAKITVIIRENKFKKE